MTTNCSCRFWKLAWSFHVLNLAERWQTGKLSDDVPVSRNGPSNSHILLGIVRETVGNGIGDRGFLGDAEHVSHGETDASLRPISD